MTETDYPEHKSLGQIAYEAYCKATDGKSLISGQPLPNWDQQADAIKNAWNLAGEAVANAEGNRD